MSVQHPIVAVTGSSGAGTTTVQDSFANIFRREGIRPVVVEGDSFHRFDREQMMSEIEKSEKLTGKPISHFGPEANMFDELGSLFKSYSESGSGRTRKYLHNSLDATPYDQKPGTFTPWEDIPEGTDLLFYEGLHGAVATDTVNCADYVDLLIGVVPTINLEWIQKVHRDTNVRGYSREAVRDTILHRMHDYVHYITPQFSRTHINFQRVPTVDTSNPFISLHVPTLDESLVVIRFANPIGVDFPYLLRMLDGSFMSRHNTIVIPGGKMELAMQLIITPIMWALMEDKGRMTRRSAPVEHSIGLGRQFDRRRP